MLFVIPDILLKRTLNTNKNGHMMSYVITDIHHDIIVAEIILKVALNTKNQSIKGRGICTCNCIWFIGLGEKD
jgi:hypothetical protein